MNEEKEQAKRPFSYPPISGANIAAQASEVKRQVMHIVDDVQLRKFCVEHAAKCSPSPQIDKLWEAMYNFITNKEKTDDKTS
jgi:hypothetical protein